MENNAFKVCEAIEEDSKHETKNERRSSNVEKENVLDIDNTDENSNRTCCSCCFFKKGGSEVPHSSTEFQNGNVLGGQVRRNFSDELRSFLNSVIYFVFVIVATFSISVMLFAELIIDTAEDSSTDGVNNNQWGVSPVIHWLSFAVLTIFFMELIIRAITMRLSLLRDFVSLIDCVVCFIAFVANLSITLILGTRSPLDAISLIIMLRLIRIWSLVNIKSEMVRKMATLRLQEKEEKLITAENTISSMRRQIIEKDFHIKQLHAHLSNSDLDDPQLKALLKQSKTGYGATADGDLEMAIALSKQTYNEENVYGSKPTQEPFDLSNFDESPADHCILVHPRPRRDEVLPITANVLEEYFPKPPNTAAHLARTSPGAIRKVKNATVDKDRIDQYIGPILGTCDDTAVKDPITICIDPDILKCDEEDDTVSNNQTGKPSQNEFDIHPDSTIVSCTEQPRSATSQPSSGPVSSDECSMEAESASTPKSVHKLLPSMLNKHSGSSLGSESGYQSEDLGHNPGKFTALNCSATEVNNPQAQSSHEFVQLNPLQL